MTESLDFQDLNSKGTFKNIIFYLNFYIQNSQKGLVLNSKLLKVENNNYYNEYDENAFSCFVQTNFGAASNNLSELYKELGIMSCSIGGTGSSITNADSSVMGVSNNNINTNKVKSTNNDVVIVGFLSCFYLFSVLLKTEYSK